MIWLSFIKPTSNIPPTAQIWFGLVPQIQLLIFCTQDKHDLVWSVKPNINIPSTAQIWFGLVPQSQFLIGDLQNKHDYLWLYKTTFQHSVQGMSMICIGTYFPSSLVLWGTTLLLFGVISFNSLGNFDDPQHDLNELWKFEQGNRQPLLQPHQKQQVS